MSSFANKLNASFSERFIYLHEINYPVVKNDFKRAYRSKKIGDIFKSYPDLYNNRISFEGIGESVIGSIKYNKVRSIFTCSIMVDFYKFGGFDVADMNKLRFEGSFDVNYGYSKRNEDELFIPNKILDDNFIFEKNAKLEDWIFCNVLTFTIGEENLLLQATLDHKADFERIYFHKNIECNVWHFQKNCPASFDTPYLPL